MSIAVSAVITPSRLLRRALLAYALASAGAATTLLTKGGGSFHFPWLLAAACGFAAGLAWRAAARAGTTRRIDISGLGEIRLTVQQSMGEAAPRELVTLMPGTTVWPHALLLLLRDAGNGRRSVLVILPDSLSTVQFRQTGVALRTIARRDNKYSEKHKIH